MNLTCNSTLEDLRILPTSEVQIAGSLTFHQLALIIGGASTIFAVALSFFLIMMHATHYTKPREQKHIIRILFMVPIYAVASWLSMRFYWHAVYFEVISDCYEAFAISSFFALLCHYMGPDIHEQKEYFRHMRPVKRWVWPLSWFAKCCCGEVGPWRTPRSGLTWFNIIWIGIYHYCFIRVAMTISSVASQYFGRYCESSNSPIFGHIWIIAIDCVAVTIAMYCIIQFYVQLREPLAEHKPFLKVLAIKLVIFLSFWQSTAISVGTSTLNFLSPNAVLAYPDIKIGIPSLLLCVEMAMFAILHIWAFPYSPYRDGAKTTYYPVADPSSGMPPRENEHFKRSGGFLGVRALWDAINVWDIVKAFGRGIRWLFVGVKKRHDDPSYQTTRKNSLGVGAGMDMDDLSGGKNPKFNSDTSYGGNNMIGMAIGGPGMKSTDHLPIATEFRRSQFLMRGDTANASPVKGEERAGLIAHAQPNPHGDDVSSPYRDNKARDDEELHGVHPALRQQQYQQQQYPQRAQFVAGPYDAASLSTVPEDNESYASPSRYQGPGGGRERPVSPYDDGMAVTDHGYQTNPRNSTQLRVGEALWGARPPQGPPGPTSPHGR